MQPDHRADLEKVLGAISMLSPTSFSCGGKEIDSPLEDFLYSRCYTIRFHEAAAAETEGDLIDELRNAHLGRGAQESGWIIEQALESGQIIARKGGAVRRFSPGYYLLLDGAFAPPKEGQRVTISFPRESVTAQEQFYFIFGEAISEHEENHNLVRLYWNLTAEAAPLLMNLLTQSLNRFQVPFHLKCLRHRQSFGRRDAAVLYVARKHYRITAMLAAEVHDRIRDSLRPDTPLWTKKLAHGLGLAEDPGDSFGKNRCEILAQTLRIACEKGLATVGERWAELNRQFSDRGLVLERPYLNPGSADRYEFDLYEL
jgi:hypothetical protein